MTCQTRGWSFCVEEGLSLYPTLAVAQAVARSLADRAVPVFTIIGGVLTTADNRR